MWFPERKHRYYKGELTNTLDAAYRPRVRRLLGKMYQTHVIDLMQQADADMRDKTVSERQILIVLLTVMGGLIFLRYYGNSRAVQVWISALHYCGFTGVADKIYELFLGLDRLPILAKVYWASARVFVYVLAPFVITKMFLVGEFNGSWTELLGLKKIPLQHIPVYGGMLVVILPVVVVASYSPEFQRQYPFYRLAEGESLWPWFLLWEVLYAAQFVGLEIFYRGFMLHGCKGRFGYGCIYLMMFPYMMIHFGKPMPECIGSVVAGFVLGTLSLKSGSIWGGAFVHVVVAWTMDAMSLLHRAS